MEAERIVIDVEPELEIVSSGNSKKHSLSSLTASVQTYSPLDNESILSHNQYQLEDDRYTNNYSSPGRSMSDRIRRSSSDIIVPQRSRSESGTSSSLYTGINSPPKQVSTVRNSTTKDRRNVLNSLFKRVRPQSIRNSFNSGNIINTFYCGICLENCAQSTAFGAHQCCRQHEYCMPCLSGFLSAQVSDGVIFLQCPGYQDCKAAFSMDDLRLVLNDESYARLLRLTSIKTDPNYRECPSCGCGITVNIAESLAIHCLQCGCDYCFYHSNAHVGLTCEQYAQRLSKRLKDEMIASEAFIGNLTKECPKCKASTEKNGGCNHMTCGVCRTDWCWLCSRVILSPTEHYNPGNFLGCPAAQFTDTAPLQHHNILTSLGNGLVARLLRSVLWALYILLFRMLPTVFAVTVGGVCYIVGSILLIPIVGCRQLYNQSHDTSIYPFVGLILSVFVLGICCAIVDMIWIPTFTAVFFIRQASQFGCVSPSLNDIVDNIYLYSTLITFLMLIDIDG